MKAKATELFDHLAGEVISSPARRDLALCLCASSCHCSLGLRFLPCAVLALLPERTPYIHQDHNHQLSFTLRAVHSSGSHPSTVVHSASRVLAVTQLASLIRDKCGPGEVARVGFSFSFPMEQKDSRSGRLLYWTKGYQCEGAVGNDVVAMLQEALARTGVAAKVRERIFCYCGGPCRGFC